MIIANLERVNIVLSTGDISAFWNEVCINNKMLFSCVERSFYNRLLISGEKVSDMIIMKRACSHIISSGMLDEYGHGDNEGFRVFCEMFILSCNVGKQRSDKFNTRRFEEVSFSVGEESLLLAREKLSEISIQDISVDGGVTAFNDAHEALVSSGVICDRVSFGWLLKNFDFGVDERYIESERRILISLFRNKIIKKLRS